jgi:hypothetical protein
MLTVNNDCTVFRYSGGGILTNPDLSNVTSYNVNLTHNGFTYSQAVGINLNPTPPDTLNLPCGITQDVDCTGVLQCDTTTQDIFGDVETPFSYPRLSGGLWTNGQNEVFMTTIYGNPNTSFDSLLIDGNTVFSASNNLDYSNDYSNLNPGETAAGNIRKLEIALQDAMIDLGYNCIVKLTFDVEKNVTIYEFQFLQSPTNIGTTDIRICEYQFSSTSVVCISTTRVNSVITYPRDRFYIKVDNYDDSNTAVAHWGMSQEGSGVEILYSNDKYIFFTRVANNPNVHVATYTIRTVQGQYVSYHYGVQPLATSQGGPIVNLVVNYSYALDENGNNNAVQVYTDYGTGPVIGTEIISCGPSPTSNYTCSPYWEITKEFFLCGSVGQFADGMYNLEIVIDYDDGSCDIYKECVFVGCITKCRMIEVLAENKHRIDLVAIYQSLILGVNCNLSCDELEEIYDYLTGQLDAISSSNGNGNTTNHCGCV